MPLSLGGAPITRENYLFVSDTQLPFEAENALKFCKAVQREFFIHPNNVYHVGDEVDQVMGSLYKKDIDGSYTANQEIAECKKRLKQWYAAFPKMKLATSNHGMRWARKAFEAEIPQQMIRSYQELLEAPKEWVWKDAWQINAEHRKIKMFHGMGYGGMYAYRTAALDHGQCVVFGHLHSNAGIAHLETASQSIWGMNVGCLIDREAYAFNYGKYNRFKPWLGAGVVVDGGLTPILIPYERFV